MKITLHIAVILMLSGCTTWGQMRQGLNSLQGQPLDTAIATLGFPNAENRVGSMRLVTWSTQTSGTFYLPQSSTTYGTVSTPYGGAANYSATTNYATPMSFNLSCTITLRVSDDDIILGSQYSGDMGPCRHYIRALKRMAKAAPSQPWRPVRQAPLPTIPALGVVTPIDPGAPTGSTH